MQTEPATTSIAEVQPGRVTRKPEVMDDFLRNFFVKMGLARTCETFEAEWYELKATGRLEGSQLVPDIYQRNAVRIVLCSYHTFPWKILIFTQQSNNTTTTKLPKIFPSVILQQDLEEEVAALRRELDNAKLIASKASATWDQFRKERDFHRMHHKRVAQEKNKLIGDIKRLKVGSKIPILRLGNTLTDWYIWVFGADNTAQLFQDHYAKYEPTILELKKKYELAMKEKMLISIEKDKVAAKVNSLTQLHCNLIQQAQSIIFPALPLMIIHSAYRSMPWGPRSIPPLSVVL